MQISRTSTRQKGFALLILSISLANFMAALDSTIVSVALPTISDVFNITPGTASWILTSYILVLAGCVLIFGKVSDAIGFKKIFLSGFLIFTISSFATGFLPGFLNSFYIFIATRICQAIGASMIMAIGPAMVTAYIPMELKGKAMGTVFTMQAFGGAIGPTIGGLLTQHLSWSWVFFINIPIGIFAILLGYKVIPDLTTNRGGYGFDRIGALLIFIGLSSMTFFLSEGQTFGWTSPVILGTIILMLLALGSFVWHELSVSDPLLELHLFTNRNFILTNSLIAFLFFNFAGIFFLLPFYLQNIQKLTPSLVGLIFSSLSIAIMIGGVMAGVFYNRLKGRKINIIAGIFEISGYFLLTRITIDTDPWYFFLCLVLIGTGTGMILTSASNMVMNSVSKKYQGMISSFTNIERFIPIILGVTVYNLIFTLGISGKTIPGEITREILAGIKIEDLSAGFNLAFYFAFIISIIVFVITFIAELKIHPDYLPEDPEKI